MIAIGKERNTVCASGLSALPLFTVLFRHFLFVYISRFNPFLGEWYHGHYIFDLIQALFWSTGNGNANDEVG
jgi:hypothetical protein